MLPTFRTSYCFMKIVLFFVLPVVGKSVTSDLRGYSKSPKENIRCKFNLKNKCSEGKVWFKYPLFWNHPFYLTAVGAKCCSYATIQRRSIDLVLVSLLYMCYR